MKKIISIILCAAMLVMMCCVAFGVVASAAASSISYTFTKTDRGWAQGTIKLTAGASEGGTYWLYWADDTKALDGYAPITSLSVSNGGSTSFTMPNYTAIPADATKVVGFKSSSEPSVKTVSAATAVYTIPSDKLIGWKSSQKKYSFASYSDFHISEGSYGLENYPYDNEHEKAAWSVAANRNVDFAVTTGDHINNQREDTNSAGNNPYIAQEWQSYLKNLADSDFTGPVYEAIGNHELWNYDTEGDYAGKDWGSGSKPFIAATGLDSTASSIDSGKAYFEITEPKSGDHFLFMALEGGFYTDRVNEFSDTQLNWLENKLKAYQNDGKNIFIFEHANFYKWGSGDQLDKPCYNIPLKEVYEVTNIKNESTTKLKNILKSYKNAVFVCGHTHFMFNLQLNYSDNSGTSATIIHNSAVGAVRNIVNNQRVNDKSREKTEGYIVEVYDGATIFNGVDLYKNLIVPTTTYIVNTKGNLPSPTEAPTQAPTEASYLLGDADGSGKLDVIDATTIQRYLAKLANNLKNEKAADVSGNNKVDVIDATYIQRKLAKIIDTFPAQQQTASSGAFDLAASGAAIDTLRSTVSAALTKYKAMASYDQYQALKKAYKENADYDTLNAAYNAFNTAKSSLYGADTMTVYFTNNNNWSKVYAYCWDGKTSLGSDGQYHSTYKNASWPGQECTYVETNGYGQGIYKFEIERGKYNYVIFTNGSEQSVDAPLFDINNRGYYLDGQDSAGKYKVKFYEH